MFYESRILNYHVKREFKQWSRATTWKGERFFSVSKQVFCALFRFLSVVQRAFAEGGTRVALRGRGTAHIDCNASISVSITATIFTGFRIESVLKRRPAHNGIDQQFVKSHVDLSVFLILPFYCVLQKKSKILTDAL